MRILLIAFVLLLDAAPAARAVETAALERGTAITDPATLRELDGGRFRLDRMLLPARSADAPLSNSELFALPSMTPVRQAIDGEFERYVIRHKASLPNETVGVGEAFDFQLFDQALLYSTQTRFVLAGIVNRMDRAYVSEAICGEIDTSSLAEDTFTASRPRPYDPRQRLVAAVADDAEHRVEGKGRSQGRSQRPGDHMF